MAVESFKSDSQLFSTEDPMTMQRLKNATVAPIGTVDNTTVSSLRTKQSVLGCLLQHLWVTVYTYIYHLQSLVSMPLRREILLEK